MSHTPRVRNLSPKKSIPPPKKLFYIGLLSGGAQISLTPLRVWNWSNKYVHLTLKWGFYCINPKIALVNEILPGRMTCSVLRQLLPQSCMSFLLSVSSGMADTSHSGKLRKWQEYIVSKQHFHESNAMGLIVPLWISMIFWKSLSEWTYWLSFVRRLRGLLSIWGWWWE